MKDVHETISRSLSNPTGEGFEYKIEMIFEQDPIDGRPWFDVEFSSGQRWGNHGGGHFGGWNYGGTLEEAAELTREHIARTIEDMIKLRTDLDTMIKLAKEIKNELELPEE